MAVILDDVRLPEKWSQGSAGGPAFLTTRVPTDDGDVFREQRWLNSLQRYEIAHNIKSPADIAALNAFFRGRRGAKRGFLLKDWLDATSHVNGRDAASPTDQPLGIGDGATTTFQLIKRYPDPVNPYDRPIKWPVSGTLTVALDGVPLGGGIAVARGTGVVTLTPAPALDAVITAGFEFDVPVCFADDHLSITWDTINSRSAGSVPLEEVRKWL
ncbi:MAG: TIGR02217 family protein [Sphingomonadales bacterium]|nr:TIGR02217 family protein [Sphingomonadales bacterium]MBU3992588.1 DUF2460 domain-containing protein [Alphaproteobacteria bacterium]